MNVLLLWRRKQSRRSGLPVGSNGGQRSETLPCGEKDYRPVTIGVHSW